MTCNQSTNTNGCTFCVSASCRFLWNLPGSRRTRRLRPARSAPPSSGGVSITMAPCPSTTPTVSCTSYERGSQRPGLRSVGSARSPHLGFGAPGASGGLGTRCVAPPSGSEVPLGIPQPLVLRIFWSALKQTALSALSPSFYWERNSYLWGNTDALFSVLAGGGAVMGGLGHSDVSCVSVKWFLKTLPDVISIHDSTKAAHL